MWGGCGIGEPCSCSAKREPNQKPLESAKREPARTQTSRGFPVYAEGLQKFC